MSNKSIDINDLVEMSFAEKDKIIAKQQAEIDARDSILNKINAMGYFVPQHDSSSNHKEICKEYEELIAKHRGEQ